MWLLLGHFASSTPGFHLAHHRLTHNRPLLDARSHLRSRLGTLAILLRLRLSLKALANLYILKRMALQTCRGHIQKLEIVNVLSISVLAGDLARMVESSELALTGSLCLKRLALYYYLFLLAD